MSTVQDGMSEVYGFLGSAQIYNSSIGSKLTSTMKLTNRMAENGSLGMRNSNSLERVNKIMNSVNNLQQKTMSATDYLMDILSYTGPMDEIITWMANMIVNILPEIEIAVKAVLLSNIKSTISCNSDPRIPAKLRKKYGYFNGYGWNINLSEIDLYDKLNISPFTPEGRNTYFGVQYNTEKIGGKIVDGVYQKRKLKITAKDVYELSRANDMDAFMWFIKHKSSFAQTINVNNDVRASLGIGNGDNILSQTEFSCSHSSDMAYRFLPGNTFRQNGGETTISLCMKKSVDEYNDVYTIVAATSDQKSANWYTDSSQYIMGNTGLKKQKDDNQRNFLKERPIFNLRFNGAGSTSTYRLGTSTNNFIFSILPKPFLISGAFVAKAEGDIYNAADLLSEGSAANFVKVVSSPLDGEEGFIKSLSASSEEMKEIVEGAGGNIKDILSNVTWQNLLPIKILFDENGIMDKKGNYSINEDRYAISQEKIGNSMIFYLKPMYIVGGQKTAKLVLNLIDDSYHLEDLEGNILVGSDATLYISECYRGLTIYEFNYDYVMGMKLFDPRVVAANLINMALNVNIKNPFKHSSTNRVLSDAKISEMIQKIMDEDDKDAEITDCFYSFSNEEYDRLIENAATKRLNGIPFDGNNDIIYADIESAYDLLDDYDETATLNEKTTIISNAISKAVDASCNASATNTNDSENNINSISSRNSTANTERENIIKKMIKMLTNTIVDALMSPKILMLLQVNRKLMNGDAFPVSSDKLYISPEQVMQSIKPIIKVLIKEIVEMIQKELLNLIMQRIEKLMGAYIGALSKEYLNKWRELIKQLVSLCSSRKHKTKIKADGSGQETNSHIESVDYADIIGGIDIDIPQTNKC